MLYIDGEAIYFEERIAGAFSRAGFEVDPHQGRRLLGVVEMLGLFNALRSAAAGDPDGELNEAIEAIPLKFFAEVTEFRKCEGGNVDCLKSDGKMVNHVAPMPGDL